jgi:homopolymeric O-antigen transport system permease protein
MSSLPFPHSETNASGAPARNVPLKVAEIRPSRGLLDLDLGELWRYRELLQVLTKRDIQILYKQAALGAAWAVIQPVFAVVIFSVVFGYFAKMPSGGMPYPVFAYAAVLPWTYFAEAVRRSSTGMVSDAELIRKVYFPRLIMPLASVLAPLLDFALAFIVLLGLMAWYKIAPGWQILFVIPLIIQTGLLALAVGLWLSPVNVRFRDIKHTLPFLIQVWMYASPIVYPLSLVPADWRWLYSLNPSVGLIEGFRWAVLANGTPSLEAMAMSFIVTAMLLFGGLVFFKHMERTFADTI